MRSQLRLVMHPDDEPALLEELLRDPSVVLIDGPRWGGPVPATTRSLATIGSYCIIWSPEDLAKLRADHLARGDWYCSSEHSTLQFLRCSIRGAAIIEGRLAVQSDDAPPRAAAGVERRYRQLSRAIKKTYANSVVLWLNPTAPVHPATSSRSANPSKPDTSLWVGPAARAWLLADPARCIKQSPTGRAEGRLTGSPATRR